MEQAVILAGIAFCYAAFISFTSMGLSMFFGQHDLLAVGHAIVLVVFCGGGLGFIGWTKQIMGDPLVNVACSLASLACITILVKEGSIQAAHFSDDKVVQVLVLVCMGVVGTSLVNLLILPTSARTAFSDEIGKNTDLLSDVLVEITRAFLSGEEKDLERPEFKKLNADYQKSLTTMANHLSEAKREHYLLGTEKRYWTESNLVDCLTKMAQNLGGLRSAALTQFTLLKQVPLDVGTLNHASSHPTGSLEVISEVPEIGDSENHHESRDVNGKPNGTYFSTSHSHEEPSFDAAEIFSAFIVALGPPAKGLVYTIKQILDELPFGREAEPPTKSVGDRVLQFLPWPSSPRKVVVNANFHQSLEQAISLYRNSRKEALNSLYRNKAYVASKSIERIADVEEVAASCGHYSFSLLDCAESVLSYLDILEDLKATYEEPQRSWHWLHFWSRSSPERDDSKFRQSPTYYGDDQEIALARDPPGHIKQADDFADLEKHWSSLPWTARLYRSLHVFRRDDVRFAIKVGVGAALYALPAFLTATRPFFSKWRGEWGLVSYMVVVSVSIGLLLSYVASGTNGCVQMTVGASNTTGLNRFLGTGLGALLAVLAWVLSSDLHGNANPWLLGLFGWLVSLGCFYVIIAKSNGPMGRFILLTYNLGALYAYSLSVRDEDNDDDEGGIDPAIWEIVFHRVAAVIVGCIWGIIITRFVWPISARRKLKNGLCILWLRMSLVWKRDPLAMFLLGEPQSSYMDIREEAALDSFLTYLDSLRKSACAEFELCGPFPDEIMGRITERTGRILEAFHAMNVVITKNLQATAGEAAILRHTREERFALSARISHLFSVLASSMKLEFPLNDVLPSIENSRDRLLARISEFKRSEAGREVPEQDYEMLYLYGKLPLQGESRMMRTRS